MAARSGRNNGSGQNGRNKDRFEDLSRQNREGHRRVEESLREAERIAHDGPKQPDPPYRR